MHFEGSFRWESVSNAVSKSFLPEVVHAQVLMQKGCVCIRKEIANVTPLEYSYNGLVHMLSSDAFEG